MNTHFQQFVLQTTGASAITGQQCIQTLWSGYGEIVRVTLVGAPRASVIVKYIVLPDEHSHPRGWNTDRSHARKLRSYDVETHWYRDWSAGCDDACRVPRCYAATEQDNERIIILEDLDAAGFSLRHASLDRAGVGLCLRWLAHFHARFMGETPAGLWPRGSYWHLDTRPDEWAAMADGALKQAAGEIDARLNDCQFQTLIHGDAKVANFCFSENTQAVAAVDFQYVGGGCGMKDVAYLLGSCLSEEECQQWQDELLDVYFAELKRAISVYDKVVDYAALEQEWRGMYALAWTDFYRFLLGWMPSHQKINAYTEALAVEVLASLGDK